MAQPSTKLLAIFMAVAASGSAPASKVRRPIASNSGLHFAIASGGPDANTPAVPAATSSGRPIIGAATRIWPFSAWAALILRITGMPWVPAQMWMPPFGSDRGRPPPGTRRPPSGVVGQHGVDDIADSGAASAIELSDLRAGVRERLRLRRRCGCRRRPRAWRRAARADHGLTHAARPDETDLHCVSPRYWRCATEAVPAPIRSRAST